MDYTKGEWYLEEETGLILSIPDGADSPVSVASVGGNQEPLTTKPSSETEANAHLIAAAPDMYEALKGMMEIAETAMPDTYFQSDSRVNATRAALAKAEGK